MNHPRLQIISRIQPEWAYHISQFIQQYPEFIPYLHVAPLYPNEPIPYPHIHSLFHAILHYICCSGVRFTYAKKQWDIIYPLLNDDSWENILLSIQQLSIDPNIQPKKRNIYLQVCLVMHKHNLTHQTLTISHLKILQKEVSGIGIGCIAWCKKYFTTDDDCIEYTDINFMKGFQHLYQTHTLQARKHKSNEWIQQGFGRIANIMICNILYTL